jgi:ArsR family transcriptional regulator, arsenate/arsenite/antimonite-responsive transcriptional repressor
LEIFTMPTTPHAVMTDTQAVQALAALAQLSRLQVFRWLVVAGSEGGTPGAIAQALGLPATALSFHLKELVHAGLVSQERQGRNLIYRPQLGAMQGLLGFLTANCCQGNVQLIGEGGGLCGDWSLPSCTTDGDDGAVTQHADAPSLSTVPAVTVTNDK